MKILHIITSLSNGGAQAVLYRLTTSDDNNTHQVISMMDGGGYGERLASAEIPVYTLDMTRGRVTIKGIIKLYRILRFARPDVVQTWMYHADLIGGVLARVAGIKSIVWGIRHSNLDDAIASPKTRLVAKCCALISGFVPRKIISNSTSAVPIHVALGYIKHKMVVVANGYNLSKFNFTLTGKLSLRQDLGIKKDEILLGMVARWHPQKDHGNLIEALSLLKKRNLVGWKSVLIGPGMTNENKALTALLHEYELLAQVLLIGPRSDMAVVFSALDLHILSSAGGEAFPNVLAEAMTCGVPCIATKVGDAALIVGDTGWVVPPSNSTALANAISKALFIRDNDPATWENRQELCRQRIKETYSLQTMLAGFRRVWLKVSEETDIKQTKGI